MIGIYSNFRFFPEPRHIREFVRRWDELGVDGVTLGDHIFPPTAPSRSDAAHRGMDQMTMLTVVATLSERLRVAAVAANVGLQHPLLLIRKFAQLAVLYGGERVYAGFGAGWARREFDGMGIQMPPHADRLDRLEESLQLARALFDDGFADRDGEHVVAHDLPLAPTPETPPRLLVAGGSERLVRLAGRYCDHIDLNAPSHRQSRIEPQRKLMTTVDDLEGSIAALRDAEAASGRAPGAVTVSVVITDIAFCRDSEIEAETERICASVGLPAQSLADSPFALIGEPARMADAILERQDRLGLDWIGIPWGDVERFCADVAPLLA